MVKSILYTSNPDFVPNNLEQVNVFASDNNKYYTCYAEEGSKLANVKVGAHILTTKGNNVYILSIGGSYDYAKKSNIVGIASIDYPFTTSNTSSLSSYTDHLKSMFLPTEVSDVRIASDGNICVETPEGYVAIDSQNKLKRYPVELTIDLPIYVISKPKEQVQVGDIIATGKSYGKVTSVKDNKISLISYNGTSKTVRPIEDVLFNQSMIRVVVSLTGSLGGQINPALIMALSDKKDSLLPLLMMNQNNGALGINPAMYFMMSKEDNSSLKDILMMQALSGNNTFGNLFGTVPTVPVAQVVPAATEEAATTLE
jgi:hypothetical protein